MKIIPTNKAVTLGEYQVIVPKQHFPTVRKALINTITVWYSEAADDAKSVNERLFPTLPHVVPIRSDDYSSDDESYLTGLSSVLTTQSHSSAFSVYSESSKVSRASNISQLSSFSATSSQNDTTEVYSIHSSDEDEPSTFLPTKFTPSTSSPKVSIPRLPANIHHNHVVPSLTPLLRTRRSEKPSTNKQQYQSHDSNNDTRAESVCVDGT